MNLPKSRIIPILLLAALHQIACGEEWGALSFTITFEDARGLMPTDPVVRDGTVIGRVVAVESGPDGAARVQVRIDREHRRAVHRESRYAIEDSSSRTPGSKQITVRSIRETRTPIHEGDVVEGSEGALRDLWRALSRAGDSAARAMERLADDLSRAIEDASDSPEARKLDKDLEALMDDAERVGREGWDELRKKLPEIEAQVGRLRERLERAGRSEQAQELRERFERWRESVERRWSEEE